MRDKIELIRRYLRADPCYTSDTGNSDDVQIGKHKFDKDGFCIFCGNKGVQMNLKERIEEIVSSKFHYCGLDNCTLKCKQKVTQATTDILKAVRESLPEKKGRLKSEEEMQTIQAIIEDIKVSYNNGYNQAIEDMKERLK